MLREVPACVPECPFSVGESLSLAQEKNAAAQLRQDVCKEIRKRKDDIEPFLETDVTSYLAHMSRSSTWGGEPGQLMWFSMFSSDVTSLHY